MGANGRGGKRFSGAGEARGRPVARLAGLLDGRTAGLGRNRGATTKKERSFGDFRGDTDEAFGVKDGLAVDASHKRPGSSR